MQHYPVLASTEKTSTPTLASNRLQPLKASYFHAVADEIAELDSEASEFTRNGKTVACFPDYQDPGLIFFDQTWIPNRVFWAPPEWPTQYSPILIPKVVRILVVAAGFRNFSEYVIWKTARSTADLGDNYVGSQAYGSLQAWTDVAFDLADEIETLFGGQVLPCVHLSWIYEIANEDGNTYPASHPAFINQLVPSEERLVFPQTDCLQLVFCASGYITDPPFTNTFFPHYWWYGYDPESEERFQTDIARLAAVQPRFDRFRALIYTDLDETNDDDDIFFPDLKADNDLTISRLEPLLSPYGVEFAGYKNWQFLSPSLFTSVIAEHFNLT